MMQSPKECLVLLCTGTSESGVKMSRKSRARPAHGLLRPGEVIEHQSQSQPSFSPGRFPRSVSRTCAGGGGPAKHMIYNSTDGGVRIARNAVPCHIGQRGARMCLGSECVNARVQWLTWARRAERWWWSHARPLTYSSYSGCPPNNPLFT